LRQQLDQLTEQVDGLRTAPAAAPATGADQPLADAGMTGVSPEAEATVRAVLEQVEAERREEREQAETERRERFMNAMKDRLVAGMTERLSLTEDQAAAIGPIIDRAAERVQSMRDPDVADADRPTLEEVEAVVEAELAEVLTPEQMRQVEESNLARAFLGPAARGGGMRPGGMGGRTPGGFGGRR
jgi:hypothetical protein